VQFGDAWRAARTTDYAWFAPALAVMVAAFFLRVLRWHSLFASGRRPPLGALARSLYLGYLFNNLLPMRAGEAARIIALNRISGVPIARTTGTVLIERAYDVLSLLVLFFVVLPWLPPVAWLRAAAVVALALMAGLTILALVLARTGTRFLRVLFNPFRRLSFLSPEAIARGPDELLEGVLGLVRLRIAVLAFAWTTLSWVVLGVGFWFVMIAFDLRLSPLAGILVVIGIGLAMILPSSPAALGVFEGATVIVLGTYGIDDSDALSYAVVLHVLNFLPFIVLAPFLIGSFRRTLTQRGGTF
jgi:glycosyltransferase 2 family protein